MSVSEKDIESLRRQLERVPRGVIGVAARCGCGEPTVVETAPRLEDGSPFPTLFYQQYVAHTLADYVLLARGRRPDRRRLQYSARRRWRATSPGRSPPGC